MKHLGPVGGEVLTVFGVFTLFLKKNRVLKESLFGNWNFIRNGLRKI